MINMERMYLYLDDVRTPIDPEWNVVRSYDEFVAHIKLHGLENYQCISLDHDLGEEAMQEYFRNVKPNQKLDYNNIKEKTGYDCAHWLIDEAFRTGVTLPIIYVHSANPIGASNIISLINNYYRNKGLAEKCVNIRVEHKIGDHLTEEELKRRWSIMNEDYEKNKI